MKPKALIWAGLMGVACVISASAETNPGNSSSLIGFLDPQTGAFRPLVAAAADSPDALASGTEVTGTLKITGTITVVSTSITATTPVTCSATAVIVTDPNGPITDEATSTATRSGSTATCTVTIPYEWLLLSSATDMVSLGVTVTALPSEPRVSTRQLGTFKVPANASTTSFSFKGHL